MNPTTQKPKSVRDQIKDLFDVWMEKDEKIDAIIAVFERVIGEDEVNLSRPDAYSNEGDGNRRVQNSFRAELRAKLKL